MANGNALSRFTRGCLLALMLPGIVLGVEAAAVAGLAPYERPAGAPLIRSLTVTPEMRVQATRGIAQPLPSGLGFLADQGAWHTPFVHPGVPGVYDIRGMHRRKGSANGL